MPYKTYNRILDEHLHILIAQGNHEAYEKLKKRYHSHALSLCSEILFKYPDTGISKKELVGVCDNYFPFVVKKYDSSLSCFFSFWKESTSKEIMDYLLENSYGGEASGFRGTMSLDEGEDQRYDYSDTLAEKDDNQDRKVMIFELRNIITRNEVFFSSQEIALLKLVLEGYTLRDLEHSGLLKKTSLYLTFNTAIEKLKRIVERTSKK